MNSISPTIIPTAAFNKGIKEYLKLDKYKAIMESYESINLSDPESSAEFRKMFNGYYNIRRKEEWQNNYYELFEEAKRTADLTFDDILYNIYKETGQVEKSFSSKMLATINPNKPILDSRVIRYLNDNNACIGFSGRIIDSVYKHYDEEVTEEDKRKLDPAIREYEDLELWYEEYVEGTEADGAISAFDTTFPEYKESKHFTRTRKIDWYLWLLG